MNIYTFLMSKEKNNINFPKIGSQKNQLKDQTPRNSTNNKIIKEARKLSVDQYKYRKTYHDILKVETSLLDSKVDKTSAMKQTTRQYKRTTVTTFVKRPIQSKNQDKIPGFEILRELGKGGFAEVFEAKDHQDKQYAVKKYLLSNSLGCYENQIKIGEHFFELGKLRQQFINSPGGNNLIGYVKKLRVGKKGYIVQEVGGRNLSKITQQIQGTFHKGERVYQVFFSEFHKKLAKDNLLNDLLLQIIQGVKILNNEGYLHCDLKPENILVMNNQSNQTFSCKIIDFGSSFRLENYLPKITITPEYMPPELLEAIEYDSTTYNLQKVDIWSFGCVILQLITGVPLWFKYKCKLEIKGKIILQLGYFALTNREYPKIIKKQKQICQSISKLNLIHPQFEPYRKILKRILVVNPQDRATHEQIIQMLMCVKKL